VTCSGVSGTVNSNFEYAMEFQGRVGTAGAFLASGTMVNTDRSTASCTRDGRPVECPANPEAGRKRYGVTVSGRFDPSGGTGLGGMKVEMNRPTEGTWSVK